FGARPKHPLVSRLIDALIESPPDWSESPAGTTGPAFFARHLQWRTDVTVLPRPTFYPYNWKEPVNPPHPATYGVHEWAASWRSTTGSRSRANIVRRAD